MRISIDEIYSRDLILREFVRRCKIYIDEKPCKFAILADDDANYVMIGKMENGNFAKNDDGGFKAETLFGKVEILDPQYPPHSLRIADLETKVALTKMSLKAPNNVDKRS